MFSLPFWYTLNSGLVMSLSSMERLSPYFRETGDLRMGPSCLGSPARTREAPLVSLEVEVALPFLPLLPALLTASFPALPA